MIDKLEAIVPENKTRILNNSKSYVLTHNRFITYMVPIFSDLNKAQINKVPYRDSTHHDFELLMSFFYLSLFKSNEHTEDYHLRKPNNENFLFRIEDETNIYVGEKIITFETNDIVLKRCLHLSFNDIKFPYAYIEEKTYLIFHQIYDPIQEHQN